ncbi:transport protein [Streptococcus pneumoniae]|nr:transport protein [Streptococcus pneumoniae]
MIAGPVMLLKVVIVFIVEQTIEGRFVSPLILGIPVYASAKVVISAIFEWYKVVSGLYELEGEEVKSEQ